MTNPLPYDYSRCYGQDCELKEQCQRYLTIQIDPPEMLWYNVSLKDEYGVCTDFIEDK